MIVKAFFPVPFLLDLSWLTRLEVTSPIVIARELCCIEYYSIPNRLVVFGLETNVTPERILTRHILRGLAQKISLACIMMNLGIAVSIIVLV